MKKKWSKLIKRVNRRMAMVCYKNRFLAALYYLVFDKSFFREQQSVLAGKVKHIREAEQLKANYFLLVRNTHRIEKGLLMRPRKPVFGKDYIKETVDSFEGIWGIRQKDNPQIKWFYDVLSEYFTSCGAQDEFVEVQHNRFKKIVGLAIADDDADCSKSVPYQRLDNKRSNIAFDEFYKLTRQRRSVRWFLDKPVPRELIDNAILAAAQSPSACNRQPFEYKIIDDPELVKQVVKLPMGTGGYGHNVPVMIVIVGNLDAYFDERDRHIIYIDASLANMTLMLALETMGLSSCAINWPDIEQREAKMEKFLKLDKHQRPIMCLGLGYPDPDGMVAFSEKRQLSNIRKYNLGAV